MFHIKQYSEPFLTNRKSLFPSCSDYVARGGLIHALSQGGITLIESGERLEIIRAADSDGRRIAQPVGRDWWATFMVAGTSICFRMRTFSAP